MVGQGAGCGAEYGGDGGIAGKGGIIRTSSNANIYAYNGNKYTDGTDYNSGENQLEIFAQNGVLRKVYKNMLFWNKVEARSYDYLYKMLGNTLLVDENQTASFVEVIVREELDTNKSGYINKLNNLVYGIGSGAGYIEISNGSYIVDSGMN